MISAFSCLGSGASVVVVSIATGGGAKSCESSAGAASGTNCSAASFGRELIGPANAGSVSLAGRVPSE